MIELNSCIGFKAEKDFTNDFTFREVLFNLNFQSISVNLIWIISLQMLFTIFREVLLYSTI